MAAPSRSSAPVADDHHAPPIAEVISAGREGEVAVPQSSLALEDDLQIDPISAHSNSFSDLDSFSLSILALQHRVALLKARTLQHQQLIAEMRRREQELEVSILRRQLAQLREQVSDRADQLLQLRHRCRLVSELASSVNRVMETRSALASAQRVFLSAQHVAAQMRAFGDGDAVVSDEESNLMGAAAAATLLAVRLQTDAVSGTIQAMREGQLANSLVVTSLEEEAKCIICQEVMDAGADSCALPCRHSFHPRCLSRWLSFRPVCPLCKLEIDL